MKTQNKKNSPIKQSPLRQPGESLQEEVVDIAYTEIMPIVLSLCLLFFIALYDLFRLYFNIPPQPWLWLLVGVALSIYYYKRLRILSNRLRNVKLGRDGERIVGQALDELKNDGYIIFHDLINGQFNIDHIVVGPAGVFAIETKTRSITNGDNNVIYNGKEIIIDGYADIIPVLEAKKHADWLRRFIADNAKTDINVKPVIIYAGDRFIKQTAPKTDIWVLNVKALPAYLANEKSRLDTDQIKLISSHIESHIRNYRDDKE